MLSSTLHISQPSSNLYSLSNQLFLKKMVYSMAAILLLINRIDFLTKCWSGLPNLLPICRHCISVEWKLLLLCVTKNVLIKPHNIIHNNNWHLLFVLCYRHQTPIIVREPMPKKMFNVVLNNNETWFYVTKLFKHKTKRFWGW